MIRKGFALAALCGALLFAAQANAKGTCTRAGLQAVVDSYIAAQTRGEPKAMRLADPTQYVENMKDADLNGGILSTPQKIDFHRSLLDVQACETFTEAVIANPAHPYVLGTRLRVKNGKVFRIQTLVTDADDWLFSAERTMKYSSAENWSVIPPAARADRATLKAAADAYLDLFNDKTVQVPWGSPCARLEGGLYTGQGKADDTCNIGVPSGVRLVNRRYVFDEDIGAVAVLLTFGDNGLPDSHLFRVENGKLRYVHTITVCSTFNCGFPQPKVLKAKP